MFDDVTRQALLSQPCLIFVDGHCRRCVPREEVHNTISLMGPVGTPLLTAVLKTVIGFSGGYHEIVYDCIAKKMQIPKNNQWAPHV